MDTSTGQVVSPTSAYTAASVSMRGNQNKKVLLINDIDEAITTTKMKTTMLLALFVKVQIFLLIFCTVTFSLCQVQAQLLLLLLFFLFFKNVFFQLTITLRVSHWQLSTASIRLLSGSQLEET